MKKLTFSAKELADDNKRYLRNKDYEQNANLQDLIDKQNESCHISRQWRQYTSYLALNINQKINFKSYYIPNLALTNKPMMLMLDSWNMEISIENLYYLNEPYRETLFDTLKVKKKRGEKLPYYKLQDIPKIRKQGLFYADVTSDSTPATTPAPTKAM